MSENVKHHAVTFASSMAPTPEYQRGYADGFREGYAKALEDFNAEEIHLHAMKPMIITVDPETYDEWLKKEARDTPSWHPKEGEECNTCGRKGVESEQWMCDNCRYRPGIYDEKKWEAKEG